MILRYIYGGRLSLEEYDTSDIIKILIAANELNQPNHKPESKIITKEITSSKSIDSQIITFQHVELISRWIDRLENTDEMKNLYEFKLILRGTRDGFSAKKIEENILSRVKDENFAICNNPNFGPVFGGHELILCTDNHNGMMQFPAYYELIREIGNFFVEEFEVFQIMKD
ncbi:carbohydrate-binding module family 13 protein [Rhizophagus irregularis DAOM 181602=DAOM 197198]|nr:carbohydrate-binding module family 13 protein [Rhizophagus irregularis DAOM 181602=DAOM 197198]